MSQPAGLSAIILAAGYSSRMGCFKPLLPLAGKPLVQRAIELFQSAGISDIRVVTGHRSRTLNATIVRLGASPVKNPAFSEGMFSSIQTGIRKVSKQCAGFFILPVDIPLVRTHTVSRLVADFQHHPNRILYPNYLGQRGHPPLIPSHLSADILHWNQPGGLRAFLAHHAAAAVDVPMADRFILQDLDTPAAHARAEQWMRQYHVPTVEECRTLMSDCLHLPDPLVAHCQAVAATAVCLATALADAGCQLDPDLIRSAALVHDLARLEPNHAAAGARQLRVMGFEPVAEIVARHMDLAATGNPPSPEAELVFLADKLTLGTRAVNLQDRFESRIREYRDHPGAVAKIAARWQQARAVKDHLESLTRRPLKALLNTPDVTITATGGV